MAGPQQFIGIVTAAKRMPKTITVTVSRKRVHPIVGKIQKRRTRMLTHDAQNRANVGDTVKIQACPPVSAAKRHTLIEIIKRAAVVGGIREGAAATGSLTTLADAAEEGQQHQDSAPTSTSQVQEAR